jgi:hypothetical protein
MTGIGQRTLKVVELDKPKSLLLITGKQNKSNTIILTNLLE